MLFLKREKYLSMPIHNWTRVEAGIFHDFHASWTIDLKARLNGGLLPADCYAMAEQVTGGLGPDILTLTKTTPDTEPPTHAHVGGTLLATLEPKVQFRMRPEAAEYATRKKSITIRHVSNHRILAIIEIISPGNKNSRHGIESFLRKVEEMLRAGVHLLIIDLFPPGPRDPQGIHGLIWSELFQDAFALPEGSPLTLVSYRADSPPEAFVQATAFGEPLAEMPLFLTLEEYVTLPLEVSYQSAWETVPAFWREVIEGTRES